ncbi:MAG: polysaccharide pyruvyl transferase family protein, partial [Firmicutes bacterium]|nr:polysaccharide pyruvyl transferase family protein [Bacillota bacterium]
MRVGILTFHCARNYGAVLQAYALQTYLEKQGHQVYVIDYRPS